MGGKASLYFCLSIDEIVPVGRNELSVLFLVHWSDGWWKLMRVDMRLTWRFWRCIG